MMKKRSFTRPRVVYLASPYTHKSRRVMSKRFQEVACFACELFSHNIFCFVPIAQAHPIVTFGRNGKSSWEHWKNFDLEMLRRCDELWVHCQDGWEESVGVKAEIRAAKHMKKPIRYFDGKEHLEELLENGDLDG